MLFQLVCVDRRYQRMNCVNIRELQGVLKRKFFTDLINTNDHRDFLNQSMIGLRFKTNNQLSITPDVESFFNFGTTNTSKSKLLGFQNLYSNSNILTKVGFSQYNFFSLSYILNSIQSFLLNITSIVFSLNIHSLFSIFYIPNSINFLLTSNFLNNNNSLNNNLNTQNFNTADKTTSVTFTTENISTPNLVSSSNTLFSETSNNIRFSRFTNPLISYDYKCGHYLGIWESLYPSLMTSYIEVARGIRKAPWFLSDQFSELLKNNQQIFLKKFTNHTNLKLADTDN
jgi:hypothetical protein